MFYMIIMHTPNSGAILLDGTTLADGRRDRLAHRAQVVRRRRGRSPALGLLAFAQGTLATAPHVARKVTAAAAMGVDINPAIVPAAARTDRALAMMRIQESQEVDGIFVQVPAPPAIDVDMLVARIPEALDVDVMSPESVRRYMSSPDSLPPVTVTACLDLLDGFAVDPGGLSGVIVAEPNPFTLMMREALLRRGVRMRRMLPVDAEDLEEEVRRHRLVVVAVGRPGAVSAHAMAPGTVAIDLGYYNVGGRGDIDVTGGFDHLRALAPVPGGIGPMTVSVLIERTIAAAEAR